MRRNKRNVLVVLLVVLCVNVYVALFSETLFGFRCNPDAVTAGTLLVEKRGRLGNLMIQYACVWSMSRKFGLHGSLFPHMRKKLTEVFDGLSLNQTSVCSDNLSKVDIKEFLANSDKYVQEVREKGVFLPGYPQEISLFHQYRSELIKEFRFRLDLSEASQSILRGLGRDGTYVGVHIRRTDYAHHMNWQCKGKLIRKKYFHKAMALMRRKFRNVTFVVTSDDRDWAEENVIKPNSNDTFWVGINEDRREQDLSTLASCNHSIISLGTFGFWAAYLAGGVTILPDKFSLKPYPLWEEVRMSKIPRWIFLDVNR